MTEDIPVIKFWNPTGEIKIDDKWVEKELDLRLGRITLHDSAGKPWLILENEEGDDS